MSDNERVIQYEMHIEDLIRSIQERIDDFGNSNDISEFEQGRQTAYWEVMDMIKTRHKIIIDVLNSD